MHFYSLIPPLLGISVSYREVSQRCAGPVRPFNGIKFIWAPTYLLAYDIFYYKTKQNLKNIMLLSGLGFYST